MLAVLTTLSLVGVALLYLAGGVVSFGPRRALIEPGPSRHVGALVALLFLIFAAQLWIVDSSALLHSTTGPLAGASYADVHVLLPGIRISAVAAVLAAGLVVYGVIQDKLLWFAALAIGGYAAVGVVSRGLLPAAEQKFAVAPNELARERPYIERHIAATRRAWRLDSVADARPRGRRPAHDGRRPRQRADDRQRAALGAGSPETDVRPAPGDSHVLRLRLGERRPLHDRRPISPGPCLGARAQHGVAADAQLHQRSPDVHARHGHRHGAGESGDGRGVAGAVHQGSAARVDDLGQGHAPADLLRRADERLRLRRHGAEGVRLPGRRQERLHELHRHAAECASARSSAGRSSPGSSGRWTSCCRRTSRPTRASCIGAISSNARRPPCRSSTSTPNRISS